MPAEQSWNYVQALLTSDPNWLNRYDSARRTLTGQERTQLESFCYQAKEKYSDWQSDAVLLAFTIGFTAHQLNERTGKRRRKTGEPYFTHCVECASRLMQEGFDGLTVATALLHDVAEDCHFQFLNSKKVWFDFIRQTFNQQFFGVGVGFAKDRQVGDLLAELVEGITQVDGLEEQDMARIKQTSLYSLIEDVKSRGGTHRSLSNGVSVVEITKQEEKIGLMIKSLEKAFDQALQSPDHWRIFLVKIADFWHNSQTSEFVSLEKKLRGRIFANLARIMGWFSMASDLVQNLSSEIDLSSPYLPLLADKKNNQRSINIKAEKIFSLLASDLLVPVKAITGEFFLGLHVPCNTILQGYFFRHVNQGYWPEILVPINFQELSEKAVFILPDNKYSSVRKVFQTPEGRRTYTLQRIDDPDCLFWQALGRPMSLCELVQSGNRLALVRFRQEGPSVVDLFKNQQNINPAQIPEAGFFNDKLRNTPFWLSHLDKLIAFLYEENLIFGLGQQRSQELIIIIEGKVYFLAGSDLYPQVIPELDQPPWPFLSLAGSPFQLDFPISRKQRKDISRQPHYLPYRCWQFKR